MMQEAQVRSVALFFYLALQNETAAYEATVTTLRQMQRRLSGANEQEMNSVLVHYTNHGFDKFSKKHSSSFDFTLDSGWISSHEVDLETWREFQKQADVDELLAVLWSRLLKISDEAIAKGLGVTSGTVRHRVGRGLRDLSSHLHTTTGNE